MMDGGRVDELGVEIIEAGGSGSTAKKIYIWAAWYSVNVPGA